MGLRYRKRVKIAKGIHLNFGMTGVSLSTGVPGFRKTIHSSGRVTQSVGIPGTGLSYVTTSNINKPKKANKSRPSATTRSEPIYTPVRDTVEEEVHPIIDTEVIRSIHRTADYPVDWTEALVNATPIDDYYDSTSWHYLHSVAEDILNGDIDTYLRVIEEVRPLDDLLEYGDSYEFGTDDPRQIAVEYSIKSEDVMPPINRFGVTNYNILLRDYICSCTIRVARDLFALLPIRKVLVHAIDNNKSVLSVAFDRATMNDIRFGFSSADEIIKNFVHRMSFSAENGFAPINQLD